MKKITLYLLFASVFTSFAWATPRTDALAYLNALNAKWVIKDYAGLKAVTDARLEATSEGDLVSILEYCCYLSIFDPNLEVIKQYANKGPAPVAARPTIRSTSSPPAWTFGRGV